MRALARPRLGILIDAALLVACAICWLDVSGAAQGKSKRFSQPGPEASLSVILGRPTGSAVTASVLSASAIEGYIEFGVTAGHYDRKSATFSAAANTPCEVEIGGLKPSARYVYRLRSRRAGETEYQVGAEHAFATQRAPGTTFTFAVQGDSHPEREGKMFSPDLYMLTMRNAAKDAPDFYVALGDDFSIENLIERGGMRQSDVDQVYAYQRGFLGIVGCSSPLFLVNGNHEQAGRHWLDGTAQNPGAMAGIARNAYYPLPAPGGFYSGDEEKVERVGYLRDYYAWTWGDALFVVIDPYWHSPVGVDDGRSGTLQSSAGATDQAGGRRGGRGRRGGGAEVDELAAQLGEMAGQGRRGGGKGARDLWQATLGDAQYRWLSKTLTESKARYKFVFAHHVMGTGRGGVEEAGLYEWGGQDRNGASRFAEKRPGWELPIHQLMVKTGVTIFFQGHDHVFAKQELDGVIYQSMPNPADDTYTAFNKDAYRTGTVLPNSGHVRVRVSPEGVKVEYVRAFLQKDETDMQKNGQVAFSYTVAARR